MTTQDINNQLTRIVEELGDIYIGMADNYPRFFEKLENEASNLKQIDSSNENSSISIASERINVLLGYEKQLKEENSIREKDLITTVDGELEKLSGIEIGIGGIEECSEDLELISLNAMVSALKAGNNGGAFPYITRELQRVSRLSAQYSNTIRDSGEILDREYKDLVNKIRNDQEETSNDIGSIFDSLGKIVTQLKNCGNDFTDQCSLFSSAINQVKAPVYMIIEEVQKHDIVRQSINHIILSLNEINSVPSQGDIPAQLNSLKFSCQVYELSRFIIDDIRESIQKSYDRFRTEKKAVEEIVDKLGENRISTGKDSSDDCIKENLLTMQNDVSRRLSSQLDVTYDEENAMDHVSELIDNLDEGIEHFTKVLSTIRNIHVASRIEVVKLNKLENMNNIIESIDETVSRMEMLLSEIGESVNNFRKVSGIIIADYNGYFSHVQKQLQENFQKILPIFQIIEEYQTKLKDHIIHFRQVQIEFRQFSQMIDSHLQRMAELIEEIDGINRIFTEKQQEGESLFEQKINESDFNTWELKGDEIKNLIDKFTIFIHKKVLTGGQESSDVALDDEEAQASEITLF